MLQACEPRPKLERSNWPLYPPHSGTHPAPSDQLPLPRSSPGTSGATQATATPSVPPRRTRDEAVARIEAQAIKADLKTESMADRDRRHPQPRAVTTTHQCRDWCRQSAISNSLNMAATWGEAEQRRYALPFHEHHQKDGRLYAAQASAQPASRAGHCDWRHCSRRAAIQGGRSAMLWGSKRP